MISLSFERTMLVQNEYSNSIELACQAGPYQDNYSVNFRETDLLSLILFLNLFKNMQPYLILSIFAVSIINSTAVMILKLIK